MVVPASLELEPDLVRGYPLAALEDLDDERLDSRSV